MLKTIPPVIHAKLLYVLMLMGHGDDLLICDVNHPAAAIAKDTTWGKLIDVSGCQIPELLTALLTLFPLDDFVEAPVIRMAVVDNPEGQVPIFARVQNVLDTSLGRPVEVASLERFAFYQAARNSFAVVRTSDPGPYGCFILRKGVVAL